MYTLIKILGVNVLIMYAYYFAQHWSDGLRSSSTDALGMGTKSLIICSRGEAGPTRRILAFRRNLLARLPFM